jgi:hypothetical protein
MDSRKILSGIALVLLFVGTAGAVILIGGGSDEASAQTVRFQQPTEAGPDPFTEPADVRGPDTIRPDPAGTSSGGGSVGAGPFGGTGSDLVCDRELLIRSLRARPDRLREWARVAGVDPTYSAVARYIRSLRPVTLTRDTRVTNHSFVNGRAVPFQAILRAGTAVLVDRYGRPVVRCRCGNPLLEPVYYPKAKCLYCPPRYKPPPPCEPYYKKWRKDGSDDPYGKSYDPYSSSSRERYGESYKRAWERCYRKYPHPPQVFKKKKTPPPPPEPEPEPTPPQEPPRYQPRYQPRYDPGYQPDNGYRPPDDGHGGTDPGGGGTDPGGGGTDPGGGGAEPGGGGTHPGGGTDGY